MRAEAFYKRGVSHAGKGNYDRAIADFTKAIELKPDYGEAHYNRGVAHYKKGDLDRARRDFEEASKLDPKGEAGRKARENLRRLEREETER